MAADLPECPCCGHLMGPGWVAPRWADVPSGEPTDWRREAYVKSADLATLRARVEGLTEEFEDRQDAFRTSVANEVKRAVIAEGALAAMTADRDRLKGMLETIVERGTFRVRRPGEVEEVRVSSEAQLALDALNQGDRGS